MTDTSSAVANPPPPAGAPPESPAAPPAGAPPESRIATHEARRMFLWFFLFLSFLFMLASTGRVRVIDEVMTVYQIESLVQRGNMAVPQAVQARLFYGKFDREGHPQSPYAPGQAMVAIPWYLAGRIVALHMPGIPAIAQNLASDFVTTLSSAAFAALAAALAFLLFCRLGVAPKPALLAAFLMALATPLFAYSGWFYSEPLACAVFVGAAWALFGRSAGQSESDPIPWRRALVGGALLGAAVWVRPAHFIAAPVFLLGVLFRQRGKKDVRTVAMVAAVVALIAFAYLLRNTAMFGNPFDFGYPEVAEGSKRLNSFETPIVRGLMGFLFSPGKSVFLFAPPVLLALYGLPLLWKRDRGLAIVSALAPVTYLLFYARYTQWEGGYCYGPRYLAPPIALLCLALGPAVEQISADASESIRAGVLRKLAVALFAVGLVVQCVGLATSFLEDQAPGGYYDQRFNYRMEHSPLLRQGRLLWKYVTSDAPAPIGQGFDRWFVFLAKGQVAKGTLWFIGLLLAGGAVFSAVRLRRASAHLH